MPVLPLMQAIQFAAKEHKETRRKDQITPYINHPLAVVYKLVEHGVRSDIVLMAAALHDVIEDEMTPPEEIEARFGPDVLAMVLEVTDNRLLPKSERKRLQVEKARSLSDGAKLIKMADKICNMTDLATNPPPSWTADLIRRYGEWCALCMQGYRTGACPSLEAEFDQTVSNLLAHISTLENAAAAGVPPKDDGIVNMAHHIDGEHY